MTDVDTSALSPRERQLLKLAAAGHTDTGISVRLGISESSVKTYWRRIRAKVGHYSRTELVATALRGEMGKAITALREEAVKFQTEESAQTNFYKQLLDLAPDAILLVRPDGIIQLLNVAAAGLFGWGQEELQGRHVSELVPARYRSAHAEHILEFLGSPSKREMGDHLATSAVDKSGREFPIAASLAAVGQGDDLRVICINRSLRWKK